MPNEIRSAEPTLRPEIQVLRAACDSLVVLDGLRPEELEAVAAIVRDLRKRLPNPDDGSPAAATLAHVPLIDQERDVEALDRGTRDQLAVRSEVFCPAVKIRYPGRLSGGYEGGGAPP